MKRARVAILGATGYGGAELLRLLLQHPGVEVAHATSRSAAGTPISKLHRNLHGITDLQFSAPTDQELIDDADIVFGSLPHGASAEVLAPLINAGVRVIDLSGDFRLKSLDEYRRWYKREHPHPQLLSRAQYGCPELYADEIATADLVASPGCFATSLNLALLPAARAGLLGGRADVVAITGSSGSGAVASAGTHHPTRAGTLRPYKVLSHQHVPEVIQLLGEAGSAPSSLSFTPVSAPLVRGILAICTADLNATAELDIEALYSEFYKDDPFIKVVTDREPEPGPVAGTNYVELRPRIGEDGHLHVACALDNLVKGGAGQAVQSMNLMLGLAPDTGLSWAGSWP